MLSINKIILVLGIGPKHRVPAKSEPWHSTQGTVRERQVLGQTRVWLRDGATAVMAKPSESLSLGPAL